MSLSTESVGFLGFCWWALILKPEPKLLVTLLSETMEKYSVLRLGPNCLESFSDDFSFSGKQQTGTSW